MNLGKSLDVHHTIKKMQNWMREEQIHYYLVTTSDEHNSEYVGEHYQFRKFLTGFTGSAATFILAKDGAYLWTDGRYFVQAEKELCNSGIQLMKLYEVGVLDPVEWIRKQVCEQEVVALDYCMVTIDLYEKLNLAISSKQACIQNKKWPWEMLFPKTRPPKVCRPVFLLPSQTSSFTREEKIAKIRTQMQRNCCSCHIINRAEDIMWLLGVRGNDMEHQPVALSFFVLIETKAVWYVNRKSISKSIVETMKKSNIEIVSIELFYEHLEKLASEENWKDVLMDPMEINAAIYQIVSKRKIVFAKNPTTKLKASKDLNEIACMKEAFLKDNLAITRFIIWLEQMKNMELEDILLEQLTEWDLARRVDAFRKEDKNFLEPSFSTISAFKENAAMMHYEAKKLSAKKIKGSGFYLVDSGGQYLYGTTDVTRTIAIGRITKQMKVDYTNVLKGMIALSRAVFLKGCTGRNLDILARQALWNSGNDYKCGTGHGVGFLLSVHEGPHRISWQYRKEVEETELVPGMVVTNEPGVYRENEYGIRIENCMLCKEREGNEKDIFLQFETLTFVPFEKKAILKSLLTKEEQQWINSYHETVYTALKNFLSEQEKVLLLELTRAI